MDKEYKNLLTEIPIKGYMKMESLQGMESITGLWEAFSKVNLIMV